VREREKGERKSYKETVSERDRKRIERERKEKERVTKRL